MMKGSLDVKIDATSLLSSPHQALPSCFSLHKKSDPVLGQGCSDGWRVNLLLTQCFLRFHLLPGLFHLQLVWSPKSNVLWPVV